MAVQCFVTYGVHFGDTFDHMRRDMPYRRQQTSYLLMWQAWLALAAASSLTSCIRMPWKASLTLLAMPTQPRCFVHILSNICSNSKSQAAMILVAWLLRSYSVFFSRGVQCCRTATEELHCVLLQRGTCLECIRLLILLAQPRVI